MSLKDKLNDPAVQVLGKEVLKDVVFKEMPNAMVCRPFLYAFDPESGRVLWFKMNRGGEFQQVGEYLLTWGAGSAPQLMDLSRRAARENVRLIDPASGEALWEFETDAIATPFVVIGKRVFFARSLRGAGTAGASEPLPDRAIYIK